MKKITADRVDVSGSSFESLDERRDVVGVLGVHAVADLRLRPRAVLARDAPQARLEAGDRRRVLVEVEAGTVRGVRHGGSAEHDERDLGVSGSQVVGHDLDAIGDALEGVRELAVRPVGAAQDRVRDVEHEHDV